MRHGHLRGPLHPLPGAALQRIRRLFVLRGWGGRRQEAQEQRHGGGVEGPARPYRHCQEHAEDHRCHEARGRGEGAACAGGRRQWPPVLGESCQGVVQCERADSDRGYRHSFDQCECAVVVVVVAPIPKFWNPDFRRLFVVSNVWHIAIVFIFFLLSDCIRK